MAYVIDLAAAGTIVSTVMGYRYQQLWPGI